MKRFLKDWMLPISIVFGACSYLFLSWMDCLTPYKTSILKAISVVQPLLLFCMLLMTFCRVRLDGLRLTRWHVSLLTFQTVFFLAFFLLRLHIQDVIWGAIAESVMLCFICPTATAAVVVTTKLGGNALSLTMYTILINLCVALLIPICAPFVNEAGAFMWDAFLLDFTLIASRVFPLLAGPMLLAVMLRKINPALVKKINSIPDLPFYLWAVSLSLAIAVSTRSIVHSQCTSLLLWGIAIGSLVACAVQFAFGRWMGKRENDTVAATQALGQKNTVLIIWMGYTFFSPITSLAGGFYSIWHNLYNSYQLHIKKGESDSVR